MVTIERGLGPTVRLVGQTGIIGSTPNVESQVPVATRQSRLELADNRRWHDMRLRRRKQKGPTPGGKGGGNIIPPTYDGLMAIFDEESPPEDLNNIPIEDRNYVIEKTNLGTLFDRSLRDDTDWLYKVASSTPLSQTSYDRRMRTNFIRAHGKKSAGYEKTANKLDAMGLHPFSGITTTGSYNGSLDLDGDSESKHLSALGLSVELFRALEYERDTTLSILRQRGIELKPGEERHRAIHGLFMSAHLTIPMNGIRVADLLHSSRTGEHTDGSFLKFFIDVFSHLRRFEELDEKRKSLLLEGGSTDPILEEYREYARTVTAGSYHDDLIQDYPEVVAKGIADACRAMLLLSDLPMDFFGKSKGTKGRNRIEAENSVLILAKSVAKIKQSLISELFNDNGEGVGAETEQVMLDYLTGDQLTSDRVLNFFGINKPTQARRAYRMSQQFIAAGHHPELYQALSDALAGYWRFVGLPTKEDVIDVVSTSGEVVTPVGTDDILGGIRKTIDDIQQVNRRNDFVLTASDLAGIDFGNLVVPTSVLIEKDVDSPHRLAVSFYYESPDTGETHEFTLQIDSTKKTVDWSILEEMEQATMATFLPIVNSALTVIKHQVTDEYSRTHTYTDGINEGSAARKNNGYDPDVRDPVYEERRRARIAAREAIRDRRVAEQKSQMDLDVRRNPGGIKPAIVVDEEILSGIIDVPSIEPALARQVRDTIAFINSAASLEEIRGRVDFKKLRGGEFGAGLFSVRVGKIRLVLVQDKDASSKGKWVFRIFLGGKKADSYREIGFSQ